MTGEDVRRRRQALGLTQGDLAELLDVALNSVSRWELDEARIAHPGMLDLALEALERRQQDTATDRQERQSP